MIQASHDEAQKYRAHRRRSFGGPSRDDWIRTSGLFVPNEARYRAALHPALLRYLTYVLVLNMYDFIIPNEARYPAMAGRYIPQ